MSSVEDMSANDKKPTGSPFAKLAALREALPPGTAPATEQAATTATKAAPARAVVRMERKGRGGKEVTVVEKLGLTEGELAQWCRMLKAALGCGGHVEGENVVLQGDLRSRIEPVLRGRGVAKVTIG